MNKKVAVVEENAALREQLVQILDSAKDIRCVGAYASAEEAMKHLQNANPDIVLMDIKLPGMSGIDCVTLLKKLMPAVQIIMVTIYEDTERLFSALKAGANGYLVKSAPPNSL